MHIARTGSAVPASPSLPPSRKNTVFQYVRGQWVSSTFGHLELPVNLTWLPTPASALSPPNERYCFCLSRGICGKAVVPRRHSAHAGHLRGALSEGLRLESLDHLVSLLTHLLWKEHGGKADASSFYPGLQCRRRYKPP